MFQETSEMVRLAQQNKEAKLHERLRPWLNTGRQLYSAGPLRVTLKRSAVNRLAVMVATFLAIGHSSKHCCVGVLCALGTPPSWR